MTQDFLVAMDAGHGLFTPGKRTPDDEREWSFNNKVVLAAISVLKDNGVKVLRVDDATGKTDVSLLARTNKANAAKADIYVSVHHNANTGKWGKWTGTETFTYTGGNPKSKALAKAVQSRLVDAMGLKDRGLKEQNFHVLRETRMPAILTEGGYMDSTIDIVKMRDDKVLVAAGVAIAEGVLAYFGITPKKDVVEPVACPAKGNPIMGRSVATAEQMVSFVKAQNPSFNKAIAEAYLKVGAKYGVRGDVAFCQSIIETSWFKFTGGTAVTSDQHNYCGMGVTSKGMKGASFKTIEDGVAAQVQHLFAYASKSALPVGEVLLDPRFKYVSRGIAPDWENLSNRWAMNAQYGTHILSLYSKLMATPAPKPVVKPAPKPVAKPAPAKPKYVIPTANMKLGSKGSQVVLLQRALNAAGFKLKGKVDGLFGPDTLQALERFQAIHANPVDGITGPKTRAALDRVLNK